MISEGVVFFAGVVSDIILFMQIKIIERNWTTFPVMFSFLNLFGVSKGQAFVLYL